MTFEMPTEANPVVVVCGDALDVLRAMPDGCVDAVVTDPPYGVGFDYGTSYDDSDVSYGAVLDRLFAAERCISPGGFMVVYQAAKHARRWAGWFPRDWQLLALPKNFVQAGRGDLVPATDYALWWSVGRGRQSREWQAGMARDWFLCDTVPAPRDRLSRGHPCPRPPDGVKYIVRSLCPPGGVILDPFAGSGTTGVAAVAEGRRAILVEREPKYAEICRRRVAEAMGMGAGSLLKATVPDLFSGAGE